MSNEMNINRGSGPTTPSTSEQAKSIKVLEAQWATDLKAASTLTKAKPSEDFKGETKPMQALPPPAGGGIGGNQNAITSYLQFAQLLGMLEYMQAQASQELTMTGSDLSVSQAEAGVGAAQSTYTSDIADANSLQSQAIGQICVGVLMAGTALIGGVMDGAAALFGTTEKAATVAAPEVASNLGEEVPKAPLDDNETEMDDFGNDEDEPENISPQEKENTDDDKEVADKEADKEKEEMNKLKQAEKNGGDPNAVKDPDSPTKSSWKFDASKGSMFAKIRSAVQGAQTLNAGITGVSDFMAKGYKVVSATYKSSATLSNVTQQLASAAYQSTTTTVKSLDETKEAALQMRQQEKQYRAEVSKGYQG